MSKQNAVSGVLVNIAFSIVPSRPSFQELLSLLFLATVTRIASFAVLAFGIEDLFNPHSINSKFLAFLSKNGNPGPSD